MNIKYNIVSDETYYIEGFKRYRSNTNKVLRYIAVIIRALGFFLLLFGAWASFTGNEFLVGSICLFAAAVLLFSRKIDYFLLKRNLKKSPYRYDEAVLTFNDEGVYTKSKIVDMKLSWSAFTKVSVVDDGVLLFQGPKQYNWLPDKSISDKTQLNQLRDLLDKNVS